VGPCGLSWWARPVVLMIGGQHTGLGGWCSRQCWLGGHTRQGTCYGASIIKMLSEEHASLSQKLNTGGYTTWDITSVHRGGGAQMRCNTNETGQMHVWISRW